MCDYIIYYIDIEEYGREQETDPENSNELIAEDMKDNGISKYTDTLYA